jgi:hypothetical protein
MDGVVYREKCFSEFFLALSLLIPGYGKRPFEETQPGIVRWEGGSPDYVNPNNARRNNYITGYISQAVPPGFFQTIFRSEPLTVSVERARNFLFGSC